VLWTEKILTRRELEQRVREEELRTQRSGQPFSLVRFEYPETGERSDKELETLAEFLFRNKRAVDFVGEVEAGVFVLLSPCNDPKAEGLCKRFRTCWEKQETGLSLSIERCSSTFKTGEEHSPDLKSQTPSEDAA
jgi:hypothetical protein